MAPASEPCRVQPEMSERLKQPWVSGVQSAREYADHIAASAGPGWQVKVEGKPPYGWNLIDPEGNVRHSGSLEHLHSWVNDHRQR